MKYVFAVSVCLSLFFAGSARAGDQCEAAALKWVTALEGAFGDIEGIAQGDFDELQLKATVVTSKKTKDGIVEKVRVTSDHQNEDDETWTATYDVTFLSVPEFGCFVKTYKFVGIK